ncbi:murein biosynthesis integral membrane protein MurJ [Paracoccaceae bacterium]|nr:murein biosynthesis integral membrane protein MurJ [Paracoccaceae bacterium]
MVKKKSLINNFSIVSLWTLFSRILGFLRDIFLALYLGSGPVAQAFLLAFTLPNMLRRIFAEGSFNKIFIPIFVSIRDSKKDANELVTIVFFSLFLILGLISTLGIIFMPVVIKAMAFGFLSDERFPLAVLYGRILFPYILLISLVQLFNSVLNALNLYHVSTATQGILNLFLIGSLIYSALYSGDFGYNLCLGVLISGLVNLALVFRACRLNGISLSSVHLSRLNPNLGLSKELFLKSVPIGLASGVSQINLVVGRQISSLFDGAIVWLIYADRLAQLPIALIGVALNVVTLPKLSSLKKSGRRVEGNSFLNRSMYLALIFALPASMGLIYLSSEIISSLFQRGNFSTYDSVQTGKALSLYSLSIIPISLQMLILNFYFAGRNVRVPFYYALASVFLNVSLAYTFLGAFEFLAPPIAYAITNWLVFVSLVFHSYKYGFYLNSFFKLGLLRIIISSFVMLAFLMFFKTATVQYFSNQNLTIVWLVLAISISGICYFACLRFLGIYNGIASDQSS